jgi:hypothetical protein
MLEPCFVRLLDTFLLLIMIDDDDDDANGLALADYIPCRCIEYVYIFSPLNN